MLKQSGTDTTILDQQIKLLYLQSSTAVIVSAGVAVLVAYYLWPGQGSLSITSWVVFICWASATAFLAYLKLVKQLFFFSRNLGDFDCQSF